MPGTSGARRVAAVLRALADPTRRSLWEQLARGEAAVTDMQARLGVSQPAISQHLQALRRAGLVRRRRDGRRALYRAEPAGLRPLVDWLGRYETFWNERIEQLKTHLEETEE
jgi:DNA-binding transcriptional ArsR family regulator